jgi:pyruvate, water dikinase
MELPNEKLVIPLDEVGISDRPYVGGKAASLGELSRAGIRVPPGFAVTTGAFEQFLRTIDPQGTIRTSIGQLAADDIPSATKICGEVRHRVASAELPNELREKIGMHYDALHESASPSANTAPVAVRSSATSEDSADASLAGLQETHLWLRGVDPVVQHVHKCWSSLYAVESVLYRRRLKLPEQGLAMGVVIQRMIDSRTSGVMFTRSPSTGDRSVVVIEASWGLGSAVVSGEVTPDKFVVGKITGEIVSRMVSSKVRRHRPNFGGHGIIDEEVAAEHQNIACLSDEEIHALVEIAKRVERHYGSPQDIEWAIARGFAVNDNIFLLQSRPETVWAAKEAAPVASPKNKPFDHVFSLLSGGTAKK